MTNREQELAREILKHQHIPFKGQTCVRCVQIETLAKALTAYRAEVEGEVFNATLARCVAVCKKNATQTEDLMDVDEIKLDRAISHAISNTATIIAQELHNLSPRPNFRAEHERLVREARVKAYERCAEHHERYRDCKQPLSQMSIFRMWAQAAREGRDG